MSRYPLSFLVIYFRFVGRFITLSLINFITHQSLMEAVMMMMMMMMMPRTLGQVF